MEYMKGEDIIALVNLGVSSRQLLNLDNSSSKRVAITRSSLGSRGKPAKAYR